MGTGRRGRSVQRAATTPLSGLLRVPTFATVATGLAVGGHALASGCSPSLRSVAVLAAGASLGRLALGRRTARLAPLVILTLASQLVGHLVLAAQGDVGQPVGHRHASAVAVPVVTDDAGLSAGMLAAHTLAALLCALWMHRGETRAAALARRLTHPLPLLLPAGPRAHRAGPVERAMRVQLVSRIVRSPALGRAPPPSA